MPDGHGKLPCIGEDCPKFLGAHEGYPVWFKGRMNRQFRECDECQRARVFREQWKSTRDEDDE